MAFNTRGAVGGATAGASAGAALGPWGALVGGGVGGVLGALSPDGSEEERRKWELINQALAELKGTNAEAGSSDFASNPDFNAAMGQMRERALSGGMTGADRLAAEQAQNDALTMDRMRSGAIQQGLASRGQAGGGAELALRAINGQGTTNAIHGAGATQAAAAQARALESLRQWGTMGATQAGAKDAIGQFNAQQRLNKAGMVGNLSTGAAAVSAQDAQRQRGTSAGMLQGADMAARDGMDMYRRWKKENGGY